MPVSQAATNRSMRLWYDPTLNQPVIVWIEGELPARPELPLLSDSLAASPSFSGVAGVEPEFWSRM
jgi:hypothetical protein